MLNTSEFTFFIFNLISQLFLSFEKSYIEIQLPWVERQGVSPNCENLTSSAFRVYLGAPATVRSEKPQKSHLLIETFPEKKISSKNFAWAPRYRRLKLANRFSEQKRRTTHCQFSVLDCSWLQYHGITFNNPPPLKGQNRQISQNFSRRLIMFLWDFQIESGAL